MKEWYISWVFLPSHVCIISSLWAVLYISVMCVPLGVCMCVCIYLSSPESTETNRNEELMASQSLIQIPVVCLRTSGVIILWCLILNLFSLSPTVVFLIYGGFHINIWVKFNPYSNRYYYFSPEFLTLISKFWL